MAGKNGEVCFRNLYSVEGTIYDPDKDTRFPVSSLYVALTDKEALELAGGEGVNNPFISERHGVVSASNSGRYNGEPPR